MLIDRPQIVEGGFITNTAVQTGTADPASPNPGELFFRTDLNAFRFFNNSGWVVYADSTALTAHIADDTRHLTASQNTFLDGITITAAQANTIPTLTTNLGNLTSSFNAHVSDYSLHLTADQNTFLDGLTLPSLTAAHVNFLQGVTSNVQTQLNAIKLTADTNTTNLATHIADDTRHLTASQNTFLDGVTVTSTEVNYLSGVTSNIQTQLNTGSSAKVTKAGDTMTGTLNMGANKVTSTAVPTTNADLSNKKYVDDADYLNNNPKAGLTSSDAKVPIYSDFKFSLGVWGSGSFSYIDRESKQVLYYHAQTPTRKVNAFRAYRFSDNDSFIFDNDPLSATFLNAGEYVGAVANLGTYFIFLKLSSTTAPYATTRWVLARTNGSSRWQDWTFAYDVSSLMSSQANNFSLLQDAGGDRILRMFYNNTVEVFSVYDSGLNLLREVTVYDKAADVSFTDQTSAGRTGADIAWGYNPLGIAFPFTWDPMTQSLHQLNSGWYAAQGGTGYSLSISWMIPRSWIVSGTGTLTNNIPVKANSGKRYHAYPDATWYTDDGGMSTHFVASGSAASIVTDEYSGNIFLTTRGTFNSVQAGTSYRMAYANGRIYRTWSVDVATTYTQNGVGVQMPDGSAWSKQIEPSFGQIINNNILFHGASTRYGYALISTSFSTTQFSSVARPNDTLKLDAANAIIDPTPPWPADMRASLNSAQLGTVVVSGAPTYYYVRPGFPVYLASVSGPTRTWTASSVTAPVVPNAIGSVSGLSWQYLNAWNGSLSSPTFWYLLRTATSFYMAKWTAGAWTITGPIFQDIVDAGRSARGDGQYTAYTGAGAHLLTGNGMLIFTVDIPHVGGTLHYTGFYNTVTNVHQSRGWENFNSKTAGLTATDYTAAGGYGGAAFGYSSTFGYYAFRATSNYDSAYIVSSRDIKNVGPTYTETEWMDDAAKRYEMFVTTESATGLVAYLSEYPIFLGGYYTKVPTMSVILQPSTTNYVYVTKDPADRTTVSVTTSTAVLPNSFSRMMIASIVTNASAIVSSTTYSHDGIGLPDKTGKAGQVLKTDGSALYWSDSISAPRAILSGGNSYVNVTDHQGVVYHAGNGNVSIPADTTSTIPPGFVTTIYVAGGQPNNVTINMDGGVILYWMGSGGGNSGNRTLGPVAWANLRKMGPNSWMVHGQGIT